MNQEMQTKEETINKMIVESRTNEDESKIKKSLGIQILNSIHNIHNNMRGKIIVSCKIAITWICLFCFVSVIANVLNHYFLLLRS